MADEAKPRGIEVQHSNSSAALPASCCAGGMLRLVAEDDPAFIVEALEVARSGNVYESARSPGSSVRACQAALG